MENLRNGKGYKVGEKRFKKYAKQMTFRLSRIPELQRLAQIFKNMLMCNVALISETGADLKKARAEF